MAVASTWAGVPLSRTITGTRLAALLSVAVAILVNLLTALIKPEWIQPWWLALSLLLLAAVLVPLYRGRHRDTTVRRVALASDGKSVLHLFAVTASGTVLRREYRQDGSWSDWDDHGFGGRKAWDVAAVAPAPGRIETYVADRRGTVWCRRHDRDGWSDWVALDTDQQFGAVVALDAMSGWPGHREIYAVGENGTLSHRWQRDGHPWSPWWPADRRDCGDVALSVPAVGKMESYALDREGQLWRRRYAKGRWSGWTSLGRPDDRSTSVAVSALNSRKEHQEVYVVGASGDIAHRWCWNDPPWDPWYGMPSPAHLVDVAAGITTPGRLEIVAVDSDGELWGRSYRDGGNDWSTWQRI
jgi:hypothetical protein